MTSVKVQGFQGNNHSWSIVNQNISRSFIKKGFDVDIFSTNGLDYFPNDLKPYLRNQIKEHYDIQVSYTVMRNFPVYLSNGSKNRFGIWCYEWPILPEGFAKYYNFCDKILAPSNFTRNIFLQNKIPEDRVVTIPHGFNLDQYSSKEKYNLKTKASKKILVNIGQPHLRKNIQGIFEAYGRAFSKKDDVCLVAKISTKKVENSFEANVDRIVYDFNRRYKNHAEVELIKEYVPDIVHLYNSCDIVFTMSHCEGYYLPGLEAQATGKINIAPRYGGQLDFLNDKNSLLIDGKIIRADPKMQYWKSNIMNTCFDPDINDAVDKLRLAVNSFDKLQKEHNQNIDKVLTWDDVVDKIVELSV